MTNYPGAVRLITANPSTSAVSSAVQCAKERAMTLGILVRVIDVTGAVLILADAGGCFTIPPRSIRSKIPLVIGSVKP